jgi:hypothetical protein
VSSSPGRTAVRRRLAALFALTLVPLSLSALTLTSPARADGPGIGSPWVVAVGDSYISGEAGRWAGNTDNSASGTDALGSTAYYDNASNTAEVINRCHRSKAAEVSIGGTVSAVNLACSGAQTATYTSSDGYFKPGLDFYNSGGNQGQALMLQTFAASHNVTMVSVSIGGNDFNFAGIVADCVADFLGSPSWWPDYCYDDTTVTSEMTSSNIAAVKTRISTAFQNIRTAMRNAGYADTAWTLEVQNYPSPIPASSAFRYSQSGYTRQNTGGCGFWNADADYANNTLLPTINSTVSGAATASGFANIKLLVGSARTRSACSRRRASARGRRPARSTSPSGSTRSARSRRRAAARTTSRNHCTRTTGASSRCGTASGRPTTPARRRPARACAGSTASTATASRR